PAARLGAERFGPAPARLHLLLQRLLEHPRHGKRAWPAGADPPGRRRRDPAEVTMTITVSPEEKKAGQISAANLGAAVEAIRGEGYVVLEDIVSHAHLDLLREKMDED